MMNLYRDISMKLPTLSRLVNIPASYFLLNISVLFLGGLFLLTSCDEEATVIGEDLQPQSDKFSVNYYDEFPVEVYTGFLDSLRTDEMALAIAGEFIDPVFGTTKADFITQVRLSGELVFSQEPVIDSLIVYLEIAGSYGDTNSIMVINAHELKKDVYLDSAYYSNFNQEGLYYEDVIGSANYNASDTLIRIHFNKAFAEKILDDSTALVSQEDFLQKFKGLYFTSDEPAGNGALTSFSLLSPLTSMVLFYHYPSSDTLYYEFSISESSARINLYSHDFSTADPAYRISHLDDNIEDSVSYVQGLSGVYTKLKFPTFENWRPDSLPIAINKAELVINLSSDDPYSSEYTPPEYLDIKIRNKDGIFETVYDLVLGRYYFGGNLKEGVYTFNISVFFHKYLTGYYDDPTVYIFVNADYYQADRVVLSGYNHSGKVTLKVTYTK